MHNEIGTLPFMSLDKMVKNKNKLRDSSSQVRCHINDLKGSMFVLKESLTSCSHGATEIVEKQIQNLIRKLVELQLMLNSQTLRVYVVKKRALIEKE